MKKRACPLMKYEIFFYGLDASIELTVFLNFLECVRIYFEKWIKIGEFDVVLYWFAVKDDWQRKTPVFSKLF